MPKIVRLHKCGGPEVLKLEEVPLKEPGAGEVRIKVAAIGLNRAEILFREGIYLEKPEAFPCLIGYEASGVVDAVGAQVSEFKIGDKVSTIPAFTMNKHGVYGESAIVPARAVAKYPDNLSPPEATSIWMQYLTAYGALNEFGKMDKGDFVVITAASSSVGYAAIQLCKIIGSTVIATTRGQAKKQLLLDAGAHHVIVTDSEDLEARVMEITNGKGARIIFDPIAGPIVKTLADICAYEGTIFEYGALSLAQTPFPLMVALHKGINICGYTLFQITSDPKRMARAKDYVYNHLKSGALKPVIDRTFKLEQIAEAHSYMESNQQNGKIVVVV